METRCDARERTFRIAFNDNRSFYAREVNAVLLNGMRLMAPSSTCIKRGAYNVSMWEHI